MSLARQHRAFISALTAASAPVGEGGLTPGTSPEPMVYSSATDRVAAEIRMRLGHDLRRLKEIQSIERKIDAKRDMLPEYRAWCDGLLAAGRASVASPADEVLPTVMVWSIDVGDWPRALELAEHVLTTDVALPARYQRSAPALIAEEIATVALKAQASNATFPLDVLEQVEAMTADADMHDEIRAKLMKAIGVELARDAETIEPGTPAFAAAAERALGPLRRAQELHDRAGAKDRIKRLEKALAASATAPPLPPIGESSSETSS